MALVTASGCGSDEPPPASIPSSNPADAQSAMPLADSPERPMADLTHPEVEIRTSLGAITVELDAEKAPLTVRNFLRYVENGQYDGTIFHQVLKDPPRVAIGGTYTAELEERPRGATIRNEARNGLKNLRGTVAMARRDAVDSATRDFFFNLADNEMLDHQEGSLEEYGYCVFGRVVDGMEVLDKIAAVEVHQKDGFEQIPVDPVVIESIREE